MAQQKLQYDNAVKILMLGDSGVGKSSLLSRFAEDKFSSSFITTIGVDFKTKIIEMNGKKVRVQVWDTAGQERFRTITPAYYRSVMGVILVYDITSRSSFENINYWMNNLSEHAASNICKILLANKSDLQDKREVSLEEGMELAKKYQITFSECSAKSVFNVQESFLKITEDIMNTHDTIARSKNDTNENRINGSKENKYDQQKCCK